jgi:serine/threonine protein kinase/Tol biopolymer transport system component
MTPERWQRIEEVFQSARLRQTAGERAAFLAGACGDDTELRSEVEQLLAAEDSAGSFINTAAIKIAAPAIAAEHVAEMTGKIISHYKILSPLGAGGMGEVYLAEDTRVGRKVALKLLPEYLTRDVERGRRFQQEARAVIALNHPNIVTVYEIGEADGAQFIASELVKGETLRARMSRAPLKLSEALDFAVQVANALNEAHHEGVVHRDIKPENIMIRPDGYVKVLDFGIAKLVEHSVTSTSTEAPTLFKVETNPGMVLGTAHYMSPEQARGLPVDGRTDIWSLGVVLYEMIAGRVPFEGATPSDVIASILNSEPLPLARFARDVPEAVEVVVDASLAKDREERYHAVTEMLGALRRLKQRVDSTAELERSQPPQSGQAPAPGSGQVDAAITGGVAATLPLTHTTSSAEYIVSEIKRHKIGLIAALGLIGIVAAAGIFLLYRNLTQDVSFRPPNFVALTTGGNVDGRRIDGEVSISADGKYVTYAAFDDKQQMGLYLKQVSTNSQVELVAPSIAAFLGTTFSHDGEFVYYEKVDRTEVMPSLYRVPVLGGSSVKIIDNVIGSISFSPEGKQFCYFSHTSKEAVLMIANADGTGARQIAAFPPPEFLPEEPGPSWSPDGKLIALPIGTQVGLIKTTLIGVSVADGTRHPLTKDSWTDMGRVVWLADGSGLIFTATPGENEPRTQVYFLSYPEEKLHRITNDLNGYGGISLGITSDGKTIATLQSRTSSDVWQMRVGDDESHAKRLTTEGVFDGNFGLAWIPDGRIMYSSRPGDHFDLFVINADGSNRRALTQDQYWEYGATVSPDGRYVVFQSERAGNLNLWRIDIDGNNPKQLTEGPGVDDYISFSPDSRWMVFRSTRSGKPALWKVSIDGGAPVQLADGPVVGTAVSPDGKFAAFGRIDPNGPSQPEFIIVPIDGGQPIKVLPAPTSANPGRGGFRWSADGKGIYYVDSRINVPNVWILPIDGTPPKPITNFTSDFILRYAFSRDDKQLALARGAVTSDIVLIKDFR